MANGIFYDGLNSNLLISASAVGIGNTSPSQTLTVEGSISASNHVYIEDNLYANGGYFTNPVSIYDISTSENPRLSLGRSSGESLNFSVTDSTATLYHKQDEPNAYIHALEIGNYTDSALGSAIRFFSANNDGSNKNTHLIISSSGNVGIGTILPTERLEVIGNISASGNLYLGGAMTLGGDLTIDGIVTAREFHTEFVSGSIIYQSGSTKFGDSSDDNHSFTGSLQVSGSAEVGKFLGINTKASTEKIGIGPSSEVSDNSSSYQLKLISADNYSGILTTYQYGSSLNLKAGVAGNGYANKWTSLYLKDGGTVGNGYLTLNTTGLERLRIDSAGNVGIGITSPNYKLDINGFAAGGVRLTSANFHVDYGSYTGGWARGYLIQNSDASDQYGITGQFNNDSFVGLRIGKYNYDNKGIFVASSGNIGIGTNSPEGLLHLSSGTSGDAVLIIESDTDNSNENDNPRIEFKQDGGLVRSRIGITGDGVTTDFTGSITNAAYFGTETATDLQLFRGNTAELTITGTGVGIGTTSPLTSLHVANQGSAAQLSLERADTSDTLKLVIGSSYGYLQNTTGPLSLGTSGGNQQINIETDGDVGIGTTSPNQKLTVAGSIQISENAHYYFNKTTSGANVRMLGINSSDVAYVGPIDAGPVTTHFNASSTSTAAYFYTAGGIKMSISSTGNVGIGTASPSEKLQVNGTARMGTGITEGIHYVGTGLQHWGDGGTGIDFPANDTVDILTNGTSKMRITSAGNVGINTTSPLRSLDVDGSGRFTGRIDSNNTLRGNSLQTGTVSVAPPRIDSFYMQPNPETSQMMAHPYFMSDLAAFVKRGGTVTVTGLTSPPTNHDILFKADAGIWSTSASNYSGATFTLELSGVDSVQGLSYGTWFGIQFGNSGWAPASMKIEWSTDDGVNWTTALDSSAKSDFYYTRLVNGSANITNIKLTIGQPTSSLRITNIFASDYAGSGSELYHLSTTGGTVYGNVLISGSDLTVGNDLVVSGGDITLFGTGRIQGIDTVSASTDATNKQYVDNAVSGLVDGTGTTNYVAKWSDTDTITNSVIYDNGTNVGIGTTSPQALLDVRADAASAVPKITIGNSTTSFNQVESGRIVFTEGGNVENMEIHYNGSTNRLHFNSPQDSTTGILTVERGGNVGIGTTSPSYLLEVAGTADFQNSITLNDAAAGLISWNAGTKTKLISYYPALSLGADSTEDQLWIEGSSGNVGIGTTSPDSKLEVAGNVHISGNFANRLDLDSNVKITGQYNGNGGNELTYLNMYNSGNASINMGTKHSLGYISFEAGNGSYVERMRITNTGNIGIGTTAPTTKLDILRTTGAPSLTADNGAFTISDTFVGAQMGSIPTSPYTFWIQGKDRRNNGGSFPISLNPVGGNVGIGTTSPSEKLEVAGNVKLDNGAIILSGSPAGQGAQTRYISGAATTNDLWFNVPTNGRYRFAVADSQLVEITSAGKVGIGTTSPDARLTISEADASTHTDPLITLKGGTPGTNLVGKFEYTQDAGVFTVGYAGLSGDSVSLDGGTSNTGASVRLKDNGVTKVFLHSGGSSGTTHSYFNGGNVGIGLTTPSSLLTVYKSNSGGIGGEIRLDNNNASVGNKTAITFDDTNGVGGNTAIRARIITETENSPYYGQLQFWTGNSASSSLTQKMVITGNGNVGIGTTSPTQTLDVSGSVIFRPSGTSDTISFLSLGSAQSRLYTTGNFAIWPGESEAMRLLTNGNVGIGISTPTYKLQVTGSFKAQGSDAFSYVEVTGQNVNINANSHITIGSTATDSVTIGAATGETRPTTIKGGPIYFQTTGLNRMFIDQDGDVGIGTTAPSQKLSVLGGILAGGKTTYTKSYSSLDTTGNAVAGLDSSINGQSALFTFNCFGHTGGYQKIVYSCYNAGGTWNTKKVIDEGTNDFDVEASANSTTITFTFKSTSGTKSYSPKVTVEAVGSAINSTYA